MTENEWTTLCVHYSTISTEFGNLWIAFSDKGICFASFDENALAQFQKMYPTAKLEEKEIQIEKNALNFHVKCTDFQEKVWNALLEIPIGKTATYKEIATKIGNPNASRAVGTAIGQNSIAWKIPCHRVILASGKIGQYRWGEHRKMKMIEGENKITQFIC